MDADRKIVLISSDGKKIEISVNAAKRSFLIKGILDDYPDDEEIPLNNIKSNILNKIKEYLEYYKNLNVKNIKKPLPIKDFKECADE